MKTSLVLEPEELVQLTKRSRSNAQVKVLRHLGIEHKIRPDNSVAVLRSHVEKLFGGSAETTRTVKTKEPDWEAL